MYRIWKPRKSSKLLGNIFRSKTTIHGTSFKKLIVEAQKPVEHFRRAQLVLKTVKPDESIKNIKNKIKHHAIVSIDTLMKSLTVPISNVIKNHRTTYRTMHPLEKTIVDLTVVARIKSGKPSLKVVWCSTNLHCAWIVLYMNDVFMFYCTHDIFLFAFCVVGSASICP